MIYTYILSLDSQPLVMRTAQRRPKLMPDACRPALTYRAGRPKPPRMDHPSWNKSCEEGVGKIREKTFDVLVLSWK